jgi:hypothetical protein
MALHGDNILYTLDEVVRESKKPKKYGRDFYISIIKQYS